MRARIWMMCWRDEVRRCRCRSRCLTRRRSTGRRGLKRSTPTAWPHGRGKFKELEEIFPIECGQVMEAIRKVYWYDDRTKGMSDQERLEYHQKHSGTVMRELREWIEGEFRDRRVEPNSSLGKAFQYLLNHFEKLTRFLSVREPRLIITRRSRC